MIRGVVVKCLLIKALGLVVRAAYCGQVPEMTEVSVECAGEDGRARKVGDMAC